MKSYESFAIHYESLAWYSYNYYLVDLIIIASNLPILN